jgi:hypothetical protein
MINKNISSFLKKKINNDCWNNIYLFIFPSDKQIKKWFLEHKCNTFCINKEWWKDCCNTYMCTIYKTGYLYNFVHQQKILNINSNMNDTYRKIRFYDYLLYTKKIRKQRLSDFNQFSFNIIS